MHRLFHVSEDPNIRIFLPRPSPSRFEGLVADVVFAISEKLLHNYLLPRDCPRVSYYAHARTSEHDKQYFLANSTAEYVVAIEQRWYERARECTIYCYEFPTDDFVVLDEGAGYYVSYKSVEPLRLVAIHDCIRALQERKVELRVLDSLKQLAKEVSESTLQFSAIRMRNAL